MLPPILISNVCLGKFYVSRMKSQRTSKWIYFTSTCLFLCIFIPSVTPFSSHRWICQNKYTENNVCKKFRSALDVTEKSFSFQEYNKDEDDEQHLQYGRDWLLRGKPSSPGWKYSKENRSRLDELTEWVQNDEPNRPVVCVYDPDGKKVL